MKISISNLLLITAVCGVSVVAWLDRNRLIAELEAREHQLHVDLKEREEARTIGFRQYWEIGIPPLYLSHHEEEEKLRNLVDRNSKLRPTDAAIEVVLACESYESFQDGRLPVSFIRTAMADNGWASAAELVDWLQVQRRVVEEARLDEAKTLIDNAMMSR